MTDIRVYPLFVALTRPPMLVGVTQTFFVFNLMGCVILFLGSLAFIDFSTLPFVFISLLGIFIVLHTVGVIGCKQDPLFFDLWLGKFELPCPNRKLWKCNSYDPS